MDSLKHHVVQLEACGPISVYIQGDQDKMKEGVVFLTVHDVGASYQTLVDFISHPSMEQIKGRCVFLHVAVPGQEPEQEDLPRDFTFPSMAQLGLAIVTILDQLRVNMVVGLGDGAGANIITRFAMNHPSRVHGVIAVNPACQKANPSVMEKIKDKIGSALKPGSKLNDKNVAKYSEAYMKRTEILKELNAKVKCDILLLAGTKSKSVGDTEAIHREIAPGICSIIKVEDVTEPLMETPTKTSEALLLFVQGVGLLPTLGRRASRQDSQSEEGEGGRRKMSMTDYDTPNVRRLSLSDGAMGDSKRKNSTQEDDSEQINPTTMGDYDKPNIRRLSLTAT